jgi:hypothetical protein
MLLDPLASKRLQIETARSHEWFSEREAVLNALWERVVEKGDVLHPDTARAIVGDYSDIAATQMSMSQHSLPPSPIESPNRKSFKSFKTFIGNSARYTLDEIRDPGNTPFDEPEDIETSTA